MAIKMKNVFVPPQIVSHTEVHRANLGGEIIVGIAIALLAPRLLCHHQPLQSLVSENLGWCTPTTPLIFGHPAHSAQPGPHLCSFISQAFTTDAYNLLGPVLGSGVMEENKTWFFPQEVLSPVRKA